LCFQCVWNCHNATIVPSTTFFSSITPLTDSPDIILYDGQGGEVTVHDCNMDADLYNQYMTFSEAAGDDLDGVFASMKTKMIFLCKEHIIVQQDGAISHTYREIQ
jgi:hypothetical protein